MQYSVNGKIISKKQHACGSNEWIIMRVGADIKLKCLSCGRQIFMSIDDLNKMKKSYIEAKTVDDQDK